MKTITKKQWPWLLFIAVSILIFSGYYYLEEEHIEEFSPYLKGISFLSHFGVHYTVGIFAGLLILLLFRRILLLRRKLKLNEPIILTLTVFWSHFPDLLAGFRDVPVHSAWENIFLLHPIVDNSPNNLVWFIMIDLFLLLVYLRKRKSGQ